MFFKKKLIKCENCSSKIKGKYTFCPYCGSSLTNEDKNFKDYGLLGKGEELGIGMPMEMGFTDRIIGSLVNSLMKNLDKQFRQIDKEFGKVDKAEIRSFPNGIKIKIGPVMEAKKAPRERTFKNQITQEQIDKMSSMPRVKAEAKVRRINDKVIYELNIPGIQSPQDVFISKLESGYEIKAIGHKKVYVNSLPVNLPLKSLSIENNKLLVEFLAYQQ